MKTTLRGAMTRLGHLATRHPVHPGPKACTATTVRPHRIGNHEASGQRGASNRRGIEPLLLDRRVQRVLDLAVEWGWEIRWSDKASRHWELRNHTTGTGLVINWGLDDAALPLFSAHASTGQALANYDDGRTAAEHLEVIERFLMDVSISKDERGR